MHRRDRPCDGYRDGPHEEPHDGPRDSGLLLAGFHDRAFVSWPTWNGPVRR
jgi:hypothetical protein